MAEPFLEVEALTKSFGGLKAVNDVRFPHGTKGGHGSDRTQRGGKDHPAAFVHRDPETGFGKRPISRGKNWWA